MSSHQDLFFYSICKIHLVISALNTPPADPPSSFMHFYRHIMRVNSLTLPAELPAGKSVRVHMCVCV